MFLNLLKKKKKKVEITFLGNSHFGPQILFLPLLVPISKNVSRFSPCHYIRDGKYTRGKWQK